MAENEQALDMGTTNQAPVAEPVVESVSNEVPAESQKTAPAEKMFTQSQLQAIAAKEARKAEERAEARLRHEYESKLSQPVQQPTQNSVGGIQQQSHEDIRRLIHQEAYNMSQEAQARQIEQSWKSA